MSQGKQSIRVKPKKKAVDTNSQQSQENKKDDQLSAMMALSPSLNAAAVVEEYGKPMGEPNLAALLDSLNDSVSEVWSGDIKQSEAMLMGQAYALQSIFMSLSRRAARQDYLKQYETYLRIALKAQSQCRATLETLAAIKNPPLAIVRQANIAHGPQQVNNGIEANDSSPRAREIENSQTQLLEADHGQRLDTGAAGAAGGANQELETLGAINRPQDTRR